MEYLYFKSKKGNFGDDLNPWLWPQLFGDQQEKENALFLGIGSILHDGNKPLFEREGITKIVFGTGVRPSKKYKDFEIDDSWDIKFLRGPLSAGYFGNKFEYITDSAYAIRQLTDFQQYQETPKKYDVSFMPYFHSVEYFDWEKICQALGYHYISPLSEQGVEHTMREISASKHLITEAMHGAIVADAFRVPWHRLILSTPHTEGERISSFKWTDWMHSVGLSRSALTYVPFYRKSFLHGYIKSFTNEMLSVNFLLRGRIKEELLKSLSSVSSYTLSDDKTVEVIDGKLNDKISKF